MTNKNKKPVQGLMKKKLIFSLGLDEKKINFVFLLVMQHIFPLEGRWQFPIQVKECVMFYPKKRQPLLVRKCKCHNRLPLVVTPRSDPKRSFGCLGDRSREQCCSLPSIQSVFPLFQIAYQTCWAILVCLNKFLLFFMFLNSLDRSSFFYFLSVFFFFFFLQLYEKQQTLSFSNGNYAYVAFAYGDRSGFWSQVPLLEAC